MPCAALRCAAAGACAFAFAFAAHAGVIEGQVFDGAGRAIPGARVIVIERTRGGFLELRGPVTDTEVARGQADAHGFFSVDLGPRAVHGHVLLRCFDPQQWDNRRYTRPDDRDVTRGLKERGHAIVSCRLEDAPGWSELQREIERVGGPESDRGRILLRLGMPRETVAAQDARVEWRYPGVTYVFADGALVDTRRAAAPASPAPAAPPQAIPASNGATPADPPRTEGPR